MRAAVGPLSRLAACLLPVVGALAVRDVRTGLIVVAMQLVLLGWLCTDWRSALGRLAFGAIASTSIVISTWLYGGRDLDEALGAGLRVLSIVLPAALLTATSTPADSATTWPSGSVSRPGWSWPPRQHSSVSTTPWRRGGRSSWRAVPGGSGWTAGPYAG